MYGTQNFPESNQIFLRKGINLNIVSFLVTVSLNNIVSMEVKVPLGN
jgi:hypothetical protein